MSKALIEKAFEKFMRTQTQMVGESFYEEFKACWNTSATWQREQIIKELREYCSKGFECGYGEVISCQDLLAKLDLLEGEK